ncbi:JAB domain-containing protein [Ligilactobacillus salivarius]|uniref:JAB domain-containing protein n=1 Tax=Ligilactobacillus salivarius TaxID=1624 RepID=UPI0025A401B3|nr:JAB domain-containing protein [Ligilactobacillus salivarius]MDM8223225.1 JAB domain-containing protein [Ligilactobacillus salivarius]
MMKLGAVETIKEVVKVKQEVKTWKRMQIYSSQDLGNIISEKIGSDTQENFVLIGLNTKLQVNMLSIVFVGGVNSVHVEMPAIFQRLLMSNSSQFIIAHNHPSGNLTPSEGDIHLTRRIKRAGNLMGIKLLDHIIVNDETYTSFAEREIL